MSTYVNYTTTCRIPSNSAIWHSTRHSIYSFRHDDTMTLLQKAYSTAENAQIAEIRRGSSPLFLCDAQRSRRFDPFLQWTHTITR